MDAKELIWAHRNRLALGLLLMVINRVAGFVLPSSTKYLVDEVIIKHRGDLLMTLALAVGVATLIRQLVLSDSRRCLVSPHNGPSPRCARRSGTRSASARVVF